MVTKPLKIHVLSHQSQCRATCEHITGNALRLIQPNGIHIQWKVNPGPVTEINLNLWLWRLTQSEVCGQITESTYGWYLLLTPVREVLI